MRDFECDFQDLKDGLSECGLKKNHMDLACPEDGGKILKGGGLSILNEPPEPS